MIDSTIRGCLGQTEAPGRSMLPKAVTVLLPRIFYNRTCEPQQRALPGRRHAQSYAPFDSPQTDR